VDIDWGFAGLVGGIGFGMVFVLLLILAAVIRLTGAAVNRNTHKKVSDEPRKGA